MHTETVAKYQLNVGGLQNFALGVSVDLGSASLGQVGAKLTGGVGIGAKKEIVRDAVTLGFVALV